MMAATLIVIMAFIAFLKVLALNGGKKNERARPKNGREDCLSRHTNLKFQTWSCNVAAVAMCKSAIVKRMTRALELKAVWPLIEVRRLRKNIGKSRRNTIGLSGNKNDRLLIYSKAQDCQGI